VQQELQAQIDSCQNAVAAQTDSASYLASLLNPGGSGGADTDTATAAKGVSDESLAAKVKKTLSLDRKLVQSVSEKVKSEMKRVNIQRTKSLEVRAHTRAFNQF